VTIDRRALLFGSAGVGLTTSGNLAWSAATNESPSKPPPTEVTAILARYATGATLNQLPEAVQHQGKRSLLNWLGCAIGGSSHPAVESAIAALVPFSGAAQANLLGRSERVDAMTAALINGIGSHVFDYDDTHLKTIIHPAGPVASALLALTQARPIKGTDFLCALIIGMECECRIGNAVYPSHYELGWHITGTCGPFGAAVACGKLLGLNDTQMACALGIAASQPVGLKIQFGSMTKSFHPGRAAQNGMMAALLAERGFTADPAALEGKDGWAQAASREHDWSQVTDQLGSRFEAALNTYKPFACGIVTHPGIDASIQLRNDNHLTPSEVQSIELRANPLVLSLTGKADPRSGLEGKFSIYHCIAVAFITGAAGERQFSDAWVRDPAVVALRQRVKVIADGSVRTEQADLRVVMRNGRTFSKHVEHAVGSLEKPMSDRDLERKFEDLAQDILPRTRVKPIIELCWNIAASEDAGQIAQASSRA
jgi:2-methylcitrate dehydratase PrpD